MQGRRVYSSAPCSRNSPGPRDSENLYRDRCVALAPGPRPAHIDTDKEVPVLVADPVLDLQPDLDDPEHRAPRPAVHPDVASVVALPGTSPPPASAAALAPAVGLIILNASANFHPDLRRREREDTEVQANGGHQPDPPVDREWE